MIYLSREFVLANVNNVGAIAKVITEEIGHYIDSQINVTDSPGDEGDIFARSVFGEDLTLFPGTLSVLKAEDDAGVISIGEQTFDIEMSQIDMASLNGRLYQVHRGNTDQIYTRSSDDGINWSDWKESEGYTPNAVAMEAFNGRLYQTHRGNDDKIYTRSSTDGVNWTSWKESGGYTPQAPALQEFEGRLYQTHQGKDDKIYTRSSTDGVNWTPWTQTYGYTPIDRDDQVSTPSGYYSQLGSLTTNHWNSYSRDDILFDGNTTNGENPEEIKQIYSDLSHSIFGKYIRMTAGYLNDASYPNNYGLDIGAVDQDTVKTVVSGTTTLIQNESGNYFLGVKGDDGNLWIYGHLERLYVPIGTRVEAGTTIGDIMKSGYYNSVGQWMYHHLHLEVHAGHSYNRYKTMSPLQAYWQWRNR